MDWDFKQKLEMGSPNSIHGLLWSLKNGQKDFGLKEKMGG
jgi:hypothetical protein